MIKISREKQHHQKGQALVEFALIISLLVLILAGATDLGRAAFLRITLYDAAEEAALYGSVYPGVVSATCQSATTDGIAYRACSASGTIAGRDDVQITSTITSQACFGNTIEVTVAANMDLIFPFAGIFKKADGTSLQSITIRASAENTILSPACP
jgi:Flp pilus assembly protein TadG